MATTQKRDYYELLEVSRTVDEKGLKGTFKAVPDRDQVLPDINENLVVELYSK